MPSLFSKPTSVLLTSLSIASAALIGCSSSSDTGVPVRGGNSTGGQASSGTGAGTGTGTSVGSGGSPGTVGGASGGASPGSSGGSFNTGLGGTAPVGTSAGNGGTAVGAGGSTGPDNGYVTSGTWKGYAFTAASPAGSTTTIMPPDFSLVKSNQPLCAMGSVGASTDAVSMIGINLNQAMGKNPPQNTVTPTLGGIMVSVTNMANTPLRLQIQAADGATVAADRWCAPIPGSGGFIPWTAFNTACWDNSGTAYAKQPISSALVMVPGVLTGVTPFNFCVNSIGEADSATTGTTTGCSVTGSSGEGTGTLTTQFDARPVTRDSRNYYIQNNVWGDASSNQSITFTGVSYTINQQSATDPTNGHPVSFPSVFTGSNGGHSTTGNNLPKLVSALTTVSTGWSNNAGPGIAGVYNAAYDVWFSSSAAGDNGAGTPSGAYLMVWFYKPATAQPIGSVQASAVSIGGSTWDIWYGGLQNGRPVISYVRTSATTSLSFDLNVFIQDAVKNRPGTVLSSYALTNIFAGFEIWSGGAGLKTNNFCAIVN